jgi:peptide/nickel transport system substrate-binding protein
MSSLRVVVSLIVALLAVALRPVPGPALEPPRFGGVLRAAMVGEPPSLDLHATTAVIVQQIMWHVHETLYTYDRTFQPIPMLARGHSVTDSGRRWTVSLRRGVRFHNGKEMTAADVVASLTRWGQLATNGRALWKNVETIQAADAHTIVILLKEPSSSLLYFLAEHQNGAAIHPAEAVNAAGASQLKELIGTGPYRLVEHNPDRYIRLARFKDYAVRPEAPNGYGGKRTAYLDEIHFVPVPDVSVRLAGVETGEYQFAQSIPQNQYARIRGLPALDPRIVRPGGMAAAALNHKQGLMADKRIRQAFLAALDMEPIMAAGFGHQDFYRLDGSLFLSETPWHSRAGVTAYDRKDRAEARRLLAAAGYRGEPVRWLTTREYEWMYKNAMVAKSQLEEAGFRIDLQVVDWATLVQRRNKPELWEVFSTAFLFIADPALAVSIKCDWPGWWCHEEKDRLVAALGRETAPGTRKALIDRIQALFYEEVGHVKFGDAFALDVARKELRGEFRGSPVLYFWNAWIER